MQIGHADGATETQAHAAALERTSAALTVAFGGGPLTLHSTPTLVEVAAGELLCEVGDDASIAWVVVSGRLQAASIGVDGSERSVGIVGPGELIGESALLDEGRRGARVRALRRSQLVELDRRWLNDQLSQSPSAAVNLVRTIVERERRPPTPLAGVLTIVPLSSTVMDEARSIAEAAQGLSGFDVIGVDGAHRSHPDPGAFDWLDEVEQCNGGAVLLGDPADHEWSTTVTELADRVLFVVDATHGPDIGPLEREVCRLVPPLANATRLLSVVHPRDVDRPRDTCEWLDRRDVDRHLHLRRGSSTHVHRVARHLIGRPLSLAIGAGGVRSAGAVGTAQALAARGLAIDAVAGVSGGAIIASWLAMSESIDNLADRTEWSMQRLLDYTLPVGAVIAGKRAWSRIREAVDGRDIADAWLPLSIVSTDLTSGEPVNHTRGKMADALYASISIPGVFPPVDIDGHLHVDGAVFDAIPVEAARNLVSEGELVVVDLAPPHDRPTEALPRVMPGGRLLLRRLVPGVRSPRIPNPLDTLMRSTTVASARRRIDALETIDCHVHLNLSDFSVLEFDKVRRIVALGEAQSNGPLDDYLATDDPPLTDPTLIEAHDARPGPIQPVTNNQETDRRSRAAALAGTLSLALADLRFRARRFAVAGLASSVVLALLLQMTGVVNQLHREPYVTVDAFGGTEWILPGEADGAFTSNATFEESTFGAAAAEVSGGPVLLARFQLADQDGENDLDMILVGHDSLPADSPRLREGRLAEAEAEVVLSTAAGYSVGDTVKLGPVHTRVVGLVDGATVFAGMPLGFVPLSVAQRMVLRGERLVSAVVIEDELVDVPDGLRIVEADAVAQDALGPVERPITTLRLVQILLAVVAALIIGAVVYLATLDRLRDIAVMRAMGVRSGVISVGVAVQAVGIGLVSGIASLIIQSLLAPAFPLDVHLTSTDRVLLVATAMLVAGLASYGAIRRTLRIDPSDAFGGAGA